MRAATQPSRPSLAATSPRRPHTESSLGVLRRRGLWRGNPQVCGPFLPVNQSARAAAGGGRRQPAAVPWRLRPRGLGSDLPRNCSPGSPTSSGQATGPPLGRPKVGLLGERPSRRRERPAGAHDQQPRRRGGHAITDAGRATCRANPGRMASLCRPENPTAPASRSAHEGTETQAWVELGKVLTAFFLPSFPPVGLFRAGASRSGSEGLLRRVVGGRRRA